MPRRYIALWLPFLPTDRLRRQGSRQQGMRQQGRQQQEMRMEAAPASGAPDDPPRVLVAKDGGALRLVDCDQRAVALGLARGLTLADARARIPTLRVMDA